MLLPCHNHAAEFFFTISALIDYAAIYYAIIARREHDIVVTNNNC